MTRGSQASRDVRSVLEVHTCNGLALRCAPHGDGTLAFACRNAFSAACSASACDTSSAMSAGTSGSPGVLTASASIASAAVFSLQRQQGQRTRFEATQHQARAGTADRGKAMQRMQGNGPMATI